MQHYDVAVIGGGPAGMMAAISASDAGASVVLLEKNTTLGKKLLITGGGRCNVTNNKPVVREMLSQYKEEGKYLFSTFMQHGVAETLGWFKERGVDTHEENEGRLFPATNKAETIQQALVLELQQSSVDLRLGSAVASIKREGDGFHITLGGGDDVRATTCIVATGGTSRPETGSTGDGFAWLKTLGHTIVPNSFALVPLTLKSNWTKSLSGLTLPECKVTIVADGKKHSNSSGKVLFTHVGVTGPTILNMSKTVGDLLQYAEVILQLGLFPGKDPAAVDAILKETLATESNKKLQNALSSLLPAAFVRASLAQCSIAGDTVCNSVSRADRIKLGQYLKAILDAEGAP